jgi:hypothetical protein
MELEMPDTLTGIKLTAAGKSDQKQVIFITDLDIATELEHPVRMAIIKILSRGISDKITVKSVDAKTRTTTTTEKPVQRNALTVIEIVKLSEAHDDIETLTRNQINHHIPKMVKLGFVHKFGTLTTGKRKTNYYRRSAKQFVVTMGTPYYSEEWLERRETERLERTLRAFDIELNSKEKADLAYLLTKSELLKDKWRAKIADLAKGDLTDPKMVDMYHWLIDAYAMGNQEYLDIHQKIRDLLFRE